MPPKSLKNFCLQEIVEPGRREGGAEGGERPAGEDLQAGVRQLMDAMRNVLANIQPAPPPVVSIQTSQTSLSFV